jgi:hypothetical protein
MRTATASGYSWFEDRPAGLSEAYCLTLARGLTSDQFLSRVGSRPASLLRGIGAVFEPSMDLWSEHPDKGMLIAITDVPGDGGDWALGVEVNGFLGVTPAVIIPLSAGTRVVSHFRNIEMVDRFCWAEDGDIRLSFAPLSPCYRQGSTPDALVDVMQEVGFDLNEDSDSEDEQSAEAALALAERLTGVHLTPEFLEQATYTCGVAPVPHV